MSEQTGARVRPGPGRRGPLSALPAGCVPFVAMLIPGPVIAPGDNRLPGMLSSLLPGACGPAGYRRAAPHRAPAAAAPR